MTTPAVLLLEEEPDLAAAMQAEHRELATRLLRTRVFRVDRGHWQPPDIDHGTLGLLILDGLMMRRIELGTVRSAELVGAGDILRPWDPQDETQSLEVSTGWQVLADARVALLDAQATTLVGRWPELLVGVTARIMRRQRSLAFMMAASHFVQVDDRLLAALWHIAALWGRVTAEGVAIPFRLTHEVLGELVGAQRPSVTVGLKRLESREALVRHDHRFVLLGDPPDWSRERPKTTAREA